jgi:hypothetical protein
MGRKCDQLDTDKRYVIFQLHEAVNPVERSAAWTPRRSVSVSAWWLFLRVENEESVRFCGYEVFFWGDRAGISAQGRYAGAGLRSSRTNRRML